MFRHLALVILLALPGTVLAAPDTQPTPAQRSSDEPASEPEGRDAPSSRDWAGLWYSSFGFVDLSVDGNDVTGTYSCCRGKIDGTVQGAQIQFTWEDPIYGEGWGYWYWEDDGARLRGIFGEKDDFGTGGEWNAVRLPEPDLGEDPMRFAGRAEHPRHGAFRGEAVLSGLEGDSIQGTLRGSYDLEARGEPFKYEMWNALTGRREDGDLVLEWLDPLYKTVGDLRLTRGESGEWVGTWQPHFSDAEAERREIRFLPQK